METSYRADVSMAAKLLEEKKPKLELLSKNAYLYVSVILLVDLVIGAEPPLKKVFQFKTIFTLQLNSTWLYKGCDLQG